MSMSLLTPNALCSKKHVQCCSELGQWIEITQHRASVGALRRCRAEAGRQALCVRQNSSIPPAAGGEETASCPPKALPLLPWQLAGPCD